MESKKRKSSKGSQRAGTYRLVGRFLEACDCYAICPCWIDEVPDEGKCSGVYVWHINDGQIDGSNVAGLRVASQRVVMFVDERANEHQKEALVAVFSGRSGGPLGELGAMLGKLIDERSARIDIDWDESSPSLRIGEAVAVETEMKVGPSGRTTTLVDSAVAETFGSPTFVGLSTELRLDLDEEGMRIDVRGRNANSGWFSYTG
ncbi:MAG: DUF1326 domain-containing protein [Egibacteraceae bacterium]